MGSWLSAVRATKCCPHLCVQVYEGELVRVFINKTDVQLGVKVRISGRWQSAGSITMHRVRREVSELIGEF